MHKQVITKLALFSYALLILMIFHTVTIFMDFP